MKKVMFMMMTAAVISLASCGNKAQQAAPADADTLAVAADSTIAASDVETAINQATAQLTEQIEAKDATKLQQAIEAVQTKLTEMLKENPDAAKEYVTQVQNFLKENAEQIKAVAGDNAAIQAAVNALTAAPADAIINGLSSAVGNAQDAAKEKANEAVEEVADQAKKALGI